MKKKDNDYFSLAERQFGYCVAASALLSGMLGDYSPEKLQAERVRMHDIENSADELHHDILMRLSAEFITPIDQEDILDLVGIIDDVTDALDEVVLDLYIYHINKIPSGASELASTVDRCVGTLALAVGELRNYKKPEKLRKILVDVNNVESEADEVFTNAMHTLFSSDCSERNLIGIKEMLESLENCCDLCEHAADIIEQITIKNA